MKRITTKEILIEIETIRVTKKRSVRKKSSAQTKSDVPNSINAFVKNEMHLEHLLDKLF